MFVKTLMGLAAMLWAGMGNAMPIMTGIDLSASGGAFVSVTLPSEFTVPQVGPYELSVFDNVLMDFTSPVLPVLPAETFTFDLGVDRFRITGINEALLLDPADVFAFPLGVSITPGTTFTVTRLVTDVAAVPVPATLVLFGLGLAGLGYSRSRKA